MNEMEMMAYRLGKADAFTQIIEHLKRTPSTGRGHWRDGFINDLITLREACQPETATEKVEAR